MRHATMGLLLLVASSSCTVPTEDPTGDDHEDLEQVTANVLASAGAAPPPVLPGPTTTRAFTESSELLVNPERGYYVGYNLVAARDPAYVRAGGKSLAISVVRLDDYRDRPLDAALLDGIQRGFARAREGGFKIVLRFAYDDTPGIDTTRARVLAHVDQLEPILRANTDVIAVMQAGFIGAWGEWHSSANGLDDNPADRAAILSAVLAALPTHRQVQVRTPMAKDAAFPGGALAVEEAYSGSPRARLGHHNDCFLASASDLGTYDQPIDTWKAYVRQDGRFTAIGGETCLVYPTRTACEPAVDELEDLHWSYLNSEYNLAVLDGWDAGGCGNVVRRRLGYRFVLDELEYTEAVPPGGELAVKLDLRNIGFAAPFNRRPVEIVLTGGDTRLVAPLAGIDARAWAPGRATSVTARLRVPVTLPPGTYTLALRLPDESSSLAADPRFAIRVANQGVWDEAHGDNVLTRDLVVDPEAPGPRITAEMPFAELP